MALIWASYILNQPFMCPISGVMMSSFQQGLTQVLPGLGHQREELGSALFHPGLDAPGPPWIAVET
jgi:hypothetical protein